MSVPESASNHSFEPAGRGVYTDRHRDVLRKTLIPTLHDAYVIPIGIGVIILVLLIAAGVIFIERKKTIEFWRNFAESQSQMLAAHAYQTLNAADLILRGVINKASQERVRDVRELRSILGAREYHDLLLAWQKSIVQVSVTAIVDRNGDMVNSTSNNPPLSDTGAKINLAERDYFQRHMKDDALDLFLSAPVQNEVTGFWTFYATRKIRGVSGETLGLVLVGIESQYFIDFYGAVASPGTQYSIFLSDGTNLARYPGYDLPGAQPGQGMQGSQVFKAINSGTPSAVVSADVASELQLPGEMLILAPSRVRDYPLVVNARLSGELTLNAWRRYSITIIALALTLSALILSLAVAIRRLLLKNKAAMQALESARRQAEDEGRFKGYFLAKMSHDIRTPLNAVTGLADILAEHNLPQQSSELVSEIRNSADHLATIVNDVLDFSMLQPQQVILSEEYVLLRQLLDRIMGVAAGLPGASRLALNCAIAEDVPGTIITDRARLMQVLLNLLSNAIKYTQCGSVLLEVVMVGSVGDDCQLEFSVSDTGSGISLSQADRIFEPLLHGEQDHVISHGRTGFGLAISRRIAKRMGGDVALIRSSQSGSIFTLKLPVRRVPQAANGPGAAGKVKDALSILVADDATSSQIVMRGLLESMGHKVRLVANGQEAVDAFEKVDFDIIFLDMQMPVMDGYHAARLIRQKGFRGRSVPIVALTAYLQTAGPSGGLPGELTMFIAKPIQKRTLSTALDRLQSIILERRSAGYAFDCLPEVTVDEVKLKEMAEDLGSDGMAAAVKAFAQDLNETASKLKTQINEGDSLEVARLAHRMKGLFAQFGAIEPTQLAAELETGKSGERDRATAQLLDYVPVAIEAVKRTLRMKSVPP